MTSSATAVGPEVRAEDDQQRPEPLAAGGDDVLGRLGDHRGAGLGGLQQRDLACVELGAHVDREDLVAGLFCQHVPHPLPTRPCRPLSPAGTGSADELARLLGQIEQRAREKPKRHSSDHSNSDRDERCPARAYDLGPGSAADR